MYINNEKRNAIWDVMYKILIRTLPFKMKAVILLMSKKKTCMWYYHVSRTNNINITKKQEQILQKTTSNHTLCINVSYIGFKLSVSLCRLILLLNFLIKNISAISLFFLCFSQCKIFGSFQLKSCPYVERWLLITLWLLGCFLWTLQRH